MAYVVLLDDAVQNFMRGIQLEILEEFGVNLGLWAPPHVTLKLGFFGTDIRPFADHLAEIAHSIEPFVLRFDGLGFFPGGFAYLDVVHDPALEALRRRVVAELTERFGVEPYDLERGDGYHFHATLAHGLRESEFAAVQRRLRHMRARFTCTASHLALIFRWTDRWVTFRRAAIGTVPLVTAGRGPAIPGAP